MRSVYDDSPHGDDDDDDDDDDDTNTSSSENRFSEVQKKYQCMNVFIV